MKIIFGKEGDWQNLVKLDDVKLRDVKLTPYQEITTEKITKKFEDAQGNVMGYEHSINKISTVRLYPNDSSKEVDSNAKGIRKQIKKTS